MNSPPTSKQPEKGYCPECGQGILLVQINLPSQNEIWQCPECGFNPDSTPEPEPQDPTTKRLRQILHTLYDVTGNPDRAKEMGLHSLIVELEQEVGA